MDLVGVPETKLEAGTPASVLVARGYQEVISYSFNSVPELPGLFEPQQAGVSLQNPISADLSVMRASLIPSLVSTLQYNLNRQQSRARFFESGLRFRLEDGAVQQQPMMAALLYGTRTPESWEGQASAKVDFSTSKVIWKHCWRVQVERAIFRLYARSILRCIRGKRQLFWIAVRSWASSVRCIQSCSASWISQPGVGV
ncbi:MAG: hypothetical protein R3E61_08690 [Pseudomonadales bacterium]